MADTTILSKKSGNLQRTQWRQKCRQYLAEHLAARLGLDIEPAQVRLMPDIRDGYLWSFLPERAHLFKRQLSKLSVGAYMELCRELGKSFEAVRPDCLQNTVLGSPQVNNADDSADTTHNFSSVIVQLQAENKSLGLQLSKAHEAAAQQHDSQRQWEEQLAAVQGMLERALSDADQLRVTNHRLQTQVRKYSRQLQQSQREIKVAYSAIQRSGLNLAQE